MIRNNENFLNVVKQIINNDEYIFLEEYQGTHNKIQCKHTICNNIFMVSPNNFISANSRCPYCAKEKFITKYSGKNQYDQITTEFVSNFMKSEKYSLLSPYIKNSEKLKIRHDVCKNEFEMSWANYKSGHRCPFCMNRVKKTTDIFKKEIYNLVKDDYIIL